MSRQRRRVGEVVAIPIDNGTVAFGLILQEPLVAFFDFHSRPGEEPSADDILKNRVAFRIWVMNRPIVQGAWPVIGHVSIPAELLDTPWFFKKTRSPGESLSGVPDRKSWSPSRDRRKHSNARPCGAPRTLRIGSGTISMVGRTSGSSSCGSNASRRERRSSPSVPRALDLIVTSHVTTSG